MRKVLGTETVNDALHGTIGKTKSVVALRARVSLPDVNALDGELAELMKQKLPEA